jgi:hypothetical protein
MSVRHQLSSLGPRVSQAQPIHDVVEPHLEDAQQVFAGHAWLAFGGHEVLVELALEDAIDVSRLLLFLELQGELALFAAAAVAGRGARRGWAPLDRALGREAALALEEQFHALTSTQPTDGTGVTSHNLSTGGAG